MGWRLKILLWVAFWAAVVFVIYLLSPGADGLQIIIRVVLWAIPLIFLFAVFERLFRVREEARRANLRRPIPTEPLVLMGLGFAFFVFNAEFVFVEAKVVQAQLDSMYPDVPLELISLPFGIATVVLVASFAKAAWTHLSLEEGDWGQLRDYRETIWKSPVGSAIEFLLRVAIAISVVLLQKQIASLPKVEGIQNAINGVIILSDDFNYHYSLWLSTTMVFGFALFFLITLWLTIASLYNYDKPQWGSAALGTVSLAIPGLAICLILKWIATGSLSPFVTEPSPPGFRAILAWALCLYVLAAIVLTGMLITIFQNGSLVLGFIVRVFRMAFFGIQRIPSLVTTGFSLIPKLLTTIERSFSGPQRQTAQSGSDAAANVAIPKTDRDAADGTGGE